MNRSIAEYGMASFRVPDLGVNLSSFAAGSHRLKVLGFLNLAEIGGE